MNRWNSRTEWRNARAGAQSRIAHALDKTDAQFTRYYTVVLRTALLNSCLAANNSLSVGSPVLPSRVWVAMAIRTTNPASVALSSSFNLCLFSQLSTPFRTCAC